MRAPLTLTCDCGVKGATRIGEPWTCPGCGRTYDTAQIPAGDVAEIEKGLRRYRLLALGPPLLLAAVLVPLTVFVSTAFAFVLFVGVLAHALLVIPRMRRRTAEGMRTTSARWQLQATGGPADGAAGGVSAP